MCARGFSLIEVLVAVCLLALGALGALSSQAVAHRSANAAVLHARALSLAADVAGHVQAEGAAHYLGVDFEASITPPAAPPPCESDECSPHAVALYRVQLALYEHFPSGRIVICRDNALLDSDGLAWSCLGSADAPVVVKIGWAGARQPDRPDGGSLAMNGGWSLAELMVALAVGAILSLFAGGLLIGANAGLAAQAEAAALEDTGNYVLSTVARAVRQAGWGMHEGPFLAGGPHELRVTFAGAADGSMLNCAGMAETGHDGWSVFRLDGEVLRCRYKSGKTWSAQSMASNVRNWRVLFGVRSTNGRVNRWVEHAAVVDWGSVAAVRISFNLHGARGKQAFAATVFIGNLP